MWWEDSCWCRSRNIWITFQIESFSTFLFVSQGIWMRDFRLLSEVGVYGGGLTRLSSRVEAWRLLWAQYLSTSHQSRHETLRNLLRLPF